MEKYTCIQTWRILITIASRVPREAKASRTGSRQTRRPERDDDCIAKYVYARCFITTTTTTSTLDFGQWEKLKETRRTFFVVVLAYVACVCVLVFFFFFFYPPEPEDNSSVIAFRRNFSRGAPTRADRSCARVRIPCTVWTRAIRVHGKSGKQRRKIKRNSAHGYMSVYDENRVYILCVDMTRVRVKKRT